MRYFVKTIVTIGSLKKTDELKTVTLMFIVDSQKQHWALDKVFHKIDKLPAASKNLYTIDILCNEPFNEHHELFADATIINKDKYNFIS